MLQLFVKNLQSLPHYLGFELYQYRLIPVEWAVSVLSQYSPLLACNTGLLQQLVTAVMWLKQASP